MKILRQKEFAWRHHTGIVVGNDEIKKLRALNYPKLYVGFLDKINPLIKEFSELTGEEELIHAAIVFEPEKFPEGPYTEEKDGKEYVCLFYDNLDTAEEFGYSEIAAKLWCDVSGKEWYVKKGLFIKKFERVDPKEIMKGYFSPESLEPGNQRDLAKKICKEIERL